MKPDLSLKSLELNIDVEQWRREIQAFVDSTMDELRDINDGLARGFARFGVGIAADKSSQHVDKPTDPTSIREIPLSHASCPASSKEPATHVLPPVTGQSDDRLTHLKHQIEQRINAAPKQSHSPDARRPTALFADNT
jgi:hypothetical protein